MRPRRRHQRLVSARPRACCHPERDCVAQLQRGERKVHCCTQLSVRSAAEPELRRNRLCVALGQSLRAECSGRAHLVCVRVCSQCANAANVGTHKHEYSLRPVQHARRLRSRGRTRSGSHCRRRYTAALPVSSRGSPNWRAHRAAHAAAAVPARCVGDHLRSRSAQLLASQRAEVTCDNRPGQLSWPRVSLQRMSGHLV